MNYYNIDFTTFKYGGYARRSSEQEDRQIQSIPKQQNIINEMVIENKLNLFKMFSEKHSAFYRDNRKDFYELVDKTEQGLIDAWVCLDSTRLSRNAFDAGIIITLMDEGKLHHIRTRHRIYFNTARDKKNLQDEFTDNKFDSGKKSEDVKLGLNERYKKGLPNGKAPIGFLNDKTKEKGDRDWFVDEERFKKVKAVFQRFLLGQDSISSITKYAREELCLTTPETKKSGGNLVSRSHVHCMLKNSIFAGFFESKDEDGKGRTRRELQSSIPRIITEDERNRILAILGDKSTPMTQHHERPYIGFIEGSEGNFVGTDVKEQVICDCSHKFAYRNKTECPVCGINITKMESPKYLQYTYYYNVKRKQTKGMSYKSVREERVDEFMKEFAEKSLNISPALTEWAKKHIHELKDKEIEENRMIFESQNQAKEKLEKQKKKLREMYRKDMMTEEEYYADLAELQKQESKSVQSPYIENWMEKLEDIVDLGAEFQNIIENGTVKEKKAVLARLGSNLIWDEENLSISNKKWMDAFIEGRKLVLSKYPMFEPKNNVANKEQNALLQASCPVMLRLVDDVITYFQNSTEYFYIPNLTADTAEVA